MKALATACEKLPIELPGNMEVWLGRNAKVCMHDIRAFIEGYKRLLKEIQKESYHKILSKYARPEQELILEIMEDNPNITIEEAIAIMEDTE
jgi:hypothetical protein